MTQTTKWYQGLGSDFTFAARTLMKSKAFAITAVLTLALGIGANTAVFSVVNGVLLRPLPYPAADRIAMVWTRFPGIGIDRDGQLSSAEWADVATRTTAFARVGLFGNRGSGTITAYCEKGPCEPQRIDAVPVTAGVFPILGLAAARGRVFRDEEDRRGHDGVLVLSDKFWRAHFAADPAIVGRAVILDRLPRTVIGVMPPQFTFQNADAYVPLALAMDSAPANRGRHSYQGIARLAAGVSIEQAKAQLASLAIQLAAEFPRNYPKQLGFDVVAQPLRDVLVGNARASLLVLMGVVSLVLLISCVNVANLTLARAQARLRDLAVRAALGAGRARLIRQVLIESLLLAFVGGLLGLLIAPVAVHVLLAANPHAVPRSEGIGVDATVLAVTFGVTSLTGVLFGIFPALQAARADLASTLQNDARGASAGRSGQRVRRMLIVAEVGLAVLVVSGAGLVLQSFWRLQHVDPGLQSEHVMTMSLALPSAAYPDSTSPARFYQQLTERLAALPGVRAATIAMAMPTHGNSNWDIEIEGRRQAPGEAAPSPVVQIATPGYFAALEIPVRAGRLLDAHDDGRDGLVVVVNETMAHRYWPGGAVGRRFRIKANPPLPWFTIVGVDGDIRTEGPSRPALPQWVATTSEMVRLGGSPLEGWLMIRTSGDPAVVVPSARRELWAIDPNVNFGQIQTMSAVLAGAVAGPRFTTMLLSCFAALALSLAAIGVYGVLAYLVTQRRREIGIRRALGARASDVLRLVVGQGMWLTVCGIALGLVGSVATSRVLQGLLFETPARDPLTFAATAILLLVVALAASWLPARRAAAVNPVASLREG